jgi:hypothetical protein
MERSDKDQESLSDNGVSDMKLMPVLRPFSTTPQLAEIIDVFWAPLSALLVFQLYGSSLLSGVALVEELLPFTDIFPTATVGWILQHTVFPRLLPAPLVVSQVSHKCGYTAGCRRQARNENS